MKILSRISFFQIITYSLGVALILITSNTIVYALRVSIPGSNTIIQIEPETEELDQVSEPVGELSEPAEDIPTEPLDMDSEPVASVSEEVGEDVAQPESLGEVSETDDQASQEIGADSETAAEASENLPGAPEGEEYGLEEYTPVEMPLGDREAEGRGIE